MRHRARTLVLVALFAPALLVVVLLRLASPAAHATPDGLGALSGVYDMFVHDEPPTLGYEHCMIRLDEDSVTHDVATAAQCYADTDVGDPNAEPAARRPGEGPDGNPGPPPPPPYDGAR